MSRLRKTLLALACVLCWAIPAQAQTFSTFDIWTTDANPFGGDGIGVLTPAVGISAGQLVCPHFTVPASNRTVVSVVDDGGNTYTQVVTGEESGTFELWAYCSYTTASATAITVTLCQAACPTPAATNGGILAAVKFTGTDPADSIGGSSYGETVAAGTAFSSGAVTVAAPSSVIYGFTYLTSAATSLAIDTDGWSASGGNTTTYAGAYKPVTTNDTLDNFTVAQNRVGPTAAWEILPAAAGGCTGGVTLLGAGKCD